MILFCAYALVLLGIGLADALHNRTSEAFFVNGRASGTGQVSISIIASCIGGSATIGMAGLAWQLGTPAFWWIGSGACGLLLLTLFLARRVRESGAYTMPEMVAVFLSPAARTVVSLIITAAWIAILAAQFTAMSKLTASLTGWSAELALPVGAALIVVYSLLGGQASVIRSDVPQYGLMLLGLGIAFGYLFWTNPQPVHALPVEMLNSSFPISRLTYFMVILGGSYVVCPMLFGRLLSAKNARTAVLGSGLAVAGLVLTAILIVLLGVSCRGLIPEGTSPDNVLGMALSLMPPAVSLALLLALLSAVLSSADSCLITASTVFSNDLLRSRSVRTCRLATLGIGIAGYLLATRGHDILSLLLMANDVYVCGVVAPMFCGMLLHRRFSIHHRAATLSVLVGGSAGLLSSWQGTPETGYIGIILSVLCLLWGLKRKKVAGQERLEPECPEPRQLSPQQNDTV